ncbi:PrsW family glutamic-type intramembrane protease [Micromonospora endolithica]|uniref:PrsW family intramembrane metalloprotease n=1 Tax=Micromonospora endolithica TaxID=230091 RepID=A0A3A9ZCH4_9ACTN|nr:PrsW family glutamic-type intramembrane protease [Micromonospora endolithica]RKN46141.1 PrsW family intramembrane metalloprotease [Micromonospora endolithica]TWJ25162.1 protease prsW family protein [Micromonospora endolithica]
MAEGLVLGVAFGAGVAVFKTMDYAVAALINSRGDIQALMEILLVRGLLCPGVHASWTGLTAAALWRAGGAGPWVGSCVPSR